MDPIRNPYAPGAGQRPPELAGRDDQLTSFDITLERIARGRPERSLILTGLRGVGKTVLLNALRSSAVRAGWGTGADDAKQRLMAAAFARDAVCVITGTSAGRATAACMVEGEQLSARVSQPEIAKAAQIWR